MKVRSNCVWIFSGNMKCCCFHRPRWKNAILRQPGQLPVISSALISGVSCLPQFCQRWCRCSCGALQGTGAFCSGKRRDGAIRPDWCCDTQLKAVAAGARGRWQRAAVPQSFLPCWVHPSLGHPRVPHP